MLGKSPVAVKGLQPLVEHQHATPGIVLLHKRSGVIKVSAKVACFCVVAAGPQTSLVGLSGPISEPIAVAANRHHMSLVQQPIEDRGCPT